MDQTNEQRIPRGFGGRVRSLVADIPQGARVLRMPSDGVANGPFRELPDGEYDVIVVEGLAESLGRLEEFCSAATERLAPGGRLLIDFENLAGPRSVRYALEGRIGSFEPFGSLAEPERRLHLPRVLAAVQHAGLLVHDVISVPSREDCVGPDFVRTIFREGFLPVPYLAGLPPARYWVDARRVPVLAGSVLLGPGPLDARRRTREALVQFLPKDWEVVACGEGAEDAAFDAAVVRSRGETLWFLRPGAVVDADLFERLWTRSTVSPAAPGHDEEFVSPGDLSGVMVQRVDVFGVGPVSGEFSVASISFEDWLLRLESTGRPVQPEPGGFVPSPAGFPEERVAAEQAEALFEKWRNLELDDSGFASHDDPRCRVASDLAPPWLGRAPRLSLCMIVRDEERFLESCLESVAGVVDEMVIVDTGSTDRTVEIAEGFGARVLHHPWNEDFAEARNVALAAATGDWVLSLDADECLDPSQHEELRLLLADPGVAAYHLVFKNHHTNLASPGVIMVRLFRNLDGVEWENAIHEQMTSALMRVARPLGLRLSTSGIRVDHYGYLDEVMESRGKRERNDRLFRQHLAEHPDDVYMHYKYGDFLRGHREDYPAAREHLARAFELLCDLPPGDRTELPYAGEIAALYALELRRAGDHELAGQVLERALRELASTPNLHYVAAGLAILEGRPDVALGHYGRCLASRDQVLVVPVQEGLGSYVSITGIAHAWLLKGELDRAERLLRQSHELEPSHEVTTLLLSRLYVDRGDHGKALSVLTEHLGEFPDAPGVCQQAALLLRATGQGPSARAMAARAIPMLEQQARTEEANHLRRTVIAR